MIYFYIVLLKIFLFIFFFFLGEILEQYGSDTTKLLILSDVSPQSDRKWNPDDSHKRIEIFQRKLWRLVHDAIYLQKADNLPEISQEEFQKQVHKCWDARNYYLRVGIFVLSDL